MKKKKNGSRIKEYKDEEINTKDDREKMIGWPDQEKQKPYGGGHGWPTLIFPHTALNTYS